MRSRRDFGKSSAARLFEYSNRLCIANVQYFPRPIRPSRLARTRPWLCSSCTYWVPYPGWDGIGTCDHVLSRHYERMAMGTEEPCERYVAPRTLPMAAEGSIGGCSEAKGTPHDGTACLDCHYWQPLGLMPQVGECDNPSSTHFRMPMFSDKPTEECFVNRSLEGLDFMWCQSHRQTIYSAELPEHRSCQVFVGSVNLPVEDQAELTMAGD